MQRYILTSWQASKQSCYWPFIVNMKVISKTSWNFYELWNQINLHWTTFIMFVVLWYSEATCSIIPWLAVLFPVQGGSSGQPYDGGESSGFHLRNDWWSGQTNQRNKRSHWIASEASRVVWCFGNCTAKGIEMFLIQN